MDEAREACPRSSVMTPLRRRNADLLAQMQLFGLIVGDQPIALTWCPSGTADSVSNVRCRTGNWMFYNIPLVNPEPVLRALEPYLRVIWGRVGLRSGLCSGSRRSV